MIGLLLAGFVGALYLGYSDWRDDPAVLEPANNSVFGA